MSSKIQDALRSAQDQWMDWNGVEAVGQGKADGEDCIVVYVASRDLDVIKSIPAEFQGVPVQVHDAGGSIRAQSAHSGSP
ncbi:hypothetical protein [Longibacter sp.]|uniref:hypothetical protein n=1 Tax=Longibacter sp. TaxID=2045415 RepID=UPI003EC145CE